MAAMRGPAWHDLNNFTLLVGWTNGEYRHPSWFTRQGLCLETNIPELAIKVYTLVHGWLSCVTGSF
jgi:hypothetical protein